MANIPADIVRDVLTLVENGEVFYSKNKKVSNRFENEPIPNRKANRKIAQDNRKLNLQAELADLDDPSDDSPPGDQLDFTSRKEVDSLREMMATVSKQIRAQYNPENCSAYESLINVVNEERALYDGVFDEVTRQISQNMHERGEVLQSLKNHYSELFQSIPQYVKSIYIELGEQKALNRRMKQELIRTRRTLNNVIDDISTFDYDQNDGVFEALILHTRNDPTIPMKKFLEVYSQRLDRLEKALKNSEDERLFWMDSLKHMILKYGKENKMSALIDFHRFEQNRYLDVNYKLSSLHDFVQNSFSKLDTAFKNFTLAINSLTDDLEGEDSLTMTSLMKLRMGITSFYEIIPKAGEIIDVSIMSNITKKDSDDLRKNLRSWIDAIQIMSNTYGSVNQSLHMESWSKCNGSLDNIGIVTKDIFFMFSSSQNGNEFQRISAYEKSVMEKISSWLTKLKSRILGQGDVLNEVVWFQNQIEDVTTTRMNDPNQASKLSTWIRSVEKIENLLQASLKTESGELLSRMENLLSLIRGYIDSQISGLKETNGMLHKECIGWMLSFSKHAGAATTTSDPKELGEALRTKVIKFHDDLSCINTKELRTLTHSENIPRWCDCMETLSRDIAQFRIQ